MVSAREKPVFLHQSAKAHKEIYTGLGADLSVVQAGGLSFEGLNYE